MIFISMLQRFRFIWLNLLFVIYLWTLQPAVLQRLNASTRGEHPDWVMGGLLLGVQIFEMVGLLFKRPVSAFYAWRYPDSKAPGGYRDNLKVVLFVFTPIFHLCLAAALTGVALGLLGSGLSDKAAAPWQCFSVLLFFAVITKEAFFVALLLGIGWAGSALDRTPTQPGPLWIEHLNRWLYPPELAQITLQDAAKDIAGDLMLLAFAALAYTATWDLILADSLRRAYGADLLWAYLGVSIFFFMIYFANRSIYLMQELSIQQSRSARIFSWVSLLVVWLSALWSISKY